MRWDDGLVVVDVVVVVAVVVVPPAPLVQQPGFVQRPPPVRCHLFVCGVCSIIAVI